MKFIGEKEFLGIVVGKIRMRLVLCCVLSWCSYRLPQTSILHHIQRLKYNA
jgi:hypothetical protein